MTLRSETPHAAQYPTIWFRQPWCESHAYSALTANGKLDVAALPSPSSEGRRSAPFEAPVGSWSSIAALWSSCRCRARWTPHDNFFELGDHSHLAITISERMQQAGVTLVRNVWYCVCSFASTIGGQVILAVHRALQRWSGTRGLSCCWRAASRCVARDSPLGRSATHRCCGAWRFWKADGHLSAGAAPASYQHLRSTRWATRPSHRSSRIRHRRTGSTRSARSRPIVARHDVLRNCLCLAGLEEPLRWSCARRPCPSSA